MRLLFIILSFLFIGSSAFAQPPLNKRDQQKKAEFLAQIEAEKNYEKTREAADQAFVRKDYAEARMLYNEAIQYSAENAQWLTSKVNDLDILMAEIVAREVDSIDVIETKQVKVIENSAKSQALIESRNEEMVINTPEPPSKEVVEVKPAIQEPESTPKPQVDPEPEVAVKTPKPAPAPKPEVKPEPVERVKEDYSKYPQGRSDETFTFPDHTVRRVIVRDGIDTIVYKYVTHRWGGKFYFKDDVSIVERIWKQEVEAFEAKYPTNSADR